MKFDYLILAGTLSFIAALLHLAIIVGGPAWYRFFGAGEAIATMAEQGLLRPTIITICISAILTTWGAYAWSAAGVLPKFPLQKLIVMLITAVYLLRGFLGLCAPLSNHPEVAQNSASFWIWSSIICLIFGLVHLKGVFDKWFS